MSIVRPVGGASEFLRARPVPSSAPSYTGPGDVVASSVVWYGLRGYSGAYAAPGTGKAINIRRASDNATSDIVILTNGNLDIATANTFATVDATATASATASTTLNLTSASSTPHVGSTITGTGVVQPCYIISVGSFTAGAGTVVVNAVQTLAAASISMQYGLFVTELYDQSGGTAHATQATSGSQAQLLPVGGSNLLPALNFSGAQFYTGTIVSQSVPYSGSFVAIRTGAFTAIGAVLGTGAGHLGVGFINSTNTAFLDAGSSAFNATASDSVLHAFQFVGNTGATSVLNVDGTDTTGSAGSTSSSTAMNVGRADAGTWPLTGRFSEGGLWPGAFSSGNRSALHTNQSAYYGTP